MALGLTQPLTQMSTRCISWGKGDRCVRLTTLPPSCAFLQKSGNLNFLEPSGSLQACKGTALTLPYKRERDEGCWPKEYVIKWLRVAYFAKVMKYWNVKRKWKIIPEPNLVGRTWLLQSWDSLFVSPMTFVTCDLSKLDLTHTNRTKQWAVTNTVRYRASVLNVKLLNFGEYFHKELFS